MSHPVRRTSTFKSKLAFNEPQTHNRLAGCRSQQHVDAVASRRAAKGMVSHSVNGKKGGFHYLLKDRSFLSCRQPFHGKPS